MTNSIAKLQHKLSVARKSTQRAREKAGELMETALETGLTSGTSWALGIWSGTLTPGSKAFEFFGVPAPLAIGIAAHAGALFGVGRGMEGHFRSVGNGALSAHLFGLGQQMGREMQARSGGASPTTSLPGGIPGLSGAGVSAEDLVNLARG